MLLLPSQSAFDVGSASRLNGRVSGRAHFSVGNLPIYRAFCLLLTPADIFWITLRGGSWKSTGGRCCRTKGTTRRGSCKNRNASIWSTPNRWVLHTRTSRLSAWRREKQKRGNFQNYVGKRAVSVRRVGSQCSYAYYAVRTVATAKKGGRLFAPYSSSSCITPQVLAVLYGNIYLYTSALRARPQCLVFLPPPRSPLSSHPPLPARPLTTT